MNKLPKNHNPAGTRRNVSLWGRNLFMEQKICNFVCCGKKTGAGHEKVVWETDEDAFVMVSDVGEAVGGSFVKNSQ